MDKLLVKCILQISVWVLVVLLVTSYLENGNTIHPLYMLLIGYVTGMINFGITALLLGDK